MSLERIRSVVKWLIGAGYANNQKEIGELLGYTNESSFSQILNGKKTLPNSFIKKIASLDKQINKEWLLTGEGEMLKNKIVPLYNEAVRINPNVMMIPLVSQYAYAGYLSGYADAEYIETLPTIPVFVDRELKGTYVSFEVRGESMDDASRDSICQGDRLICRLIKQDLWQYKFHMQQWNFVIVHKTEGILVKRIIDHNTETGIITLHSLNPIYTDLQIHLNDVAQMFNVVEIHRAGRI